MLPFFRPLRALAHVLLLFDPSFLVLLDDDTFLNLPLLLSSALMKTFIVGDMQHQPVVIGELMDKGKVSERGFLVGGAGYIFNRALLNLLVAREVKDYNDRYDFLDAPPYALGLLRMLRVREYQRRQRMAHEAHGMEKGLTNSSGEDRSSIPRGKGRATLLTPPPRSPPARYSVSDSNYTDMDSVFSDGGLWATNILHPERCVIQDRGTVSNVQTQTATQMGRGPSSSEGEVKYVRLSVRLVDFCTSLLSGEHTCHHR